MAGAQTMTRSFVCVLVCLLLLFDVTRAEAAPSSRDFPPGLHVPAAAEPGPDFDVDRATEAWLALLTPEQRALSDAYFEGKYWLILWSTLYGIAMMALLLGAGASQKLRDVAERVSRRPFISTLVFGVM